MSAAAALEAVWRRESGRVVGRLVRLTGDLGLAEELAQDALVVALERWTADGVPDNPGAWLTTTASRRALDHLRRRARGARVDARLRADPEAPTHAPPVEEALDDPLGDDELRLLFLSCHPSLPREHQVALTLRLFAGLTTAEVARAFLVPEPTMAQRLTRARRALAEGRVPVTLPEGPALRERLEPVLAVVYLLFNEGYAATSGDDWLRPALCDQALRLARLLADRLPDEAEALGLLALLELQHSRADARVDADGAPVRLFDQDRARWDRAAIDRGLAALARARARGAPGPYTLQAGIAACHATAARPEDTDWAGIVAGYDALLALTPSPVVALNRAVALGFAEGPEPGLAALDALADEPALRGYALLPAARGELLSRLGRRAEARAAFATAAGLATREAERAWFRARADAQDG